MKDTTKILEEFYEKFPPVECSAHERTSSAFCICEDLPDINAENVAIKSFLTTAIQQAVAEERARVRGEIEQKVEEYKQKACVAANSLEYDEVNMLRYIERQEVRWVVNRLIDAKRDFSDLLSSLDKLVTERTNL